MFHRRPSLFKEAPHVMRVQLLNEAGATPEDEMFIDLLSQYPPKTELRPGHLVQLLRTPSHLIGQGPFPNIWEVRAVYSRWQHMLHHLVHRSGGMLDWAIAQMEIARGMHPARYREALVYAHAFPHGSWPSSAEWFPEVDHLGQLLRRLMPVAPTVDWEPILDEFSTPFMGYDPAQFGSGVVFDLAPDIYGDQRERVRPLGFEEDAFHKVCLLGLEESCMVPSTQEGLLTSRRDPNLGAFEP